jgi:predicted nucleic acid-binding protein
VIVLDASVLISYRSPGDPHHAASKRMLSHDDRYAAHTITIAEALVRGARDGRLDELVRAHNALRIDELPRVEDEARSLAEIRATTGLPMPDCCVVLSAERMAARLATHDQRLERVAVARGIEVLGEEHP